MPSEWTTGDARRQGAITKAGSAHARRLLVEAAPPLSPPAKVTVQLERRQRGQDPRVIEIAWRDQYRLYRRWRRLRLERGKPTSVVSMACARELCAFVWEAATLA